MIRKLSALNIRDVRHLCWHLGTSRRELEMICASIHYSPSRYYLEFDKIRNDKKRHFAVPLGRLRTFHDKLNALLQRIEIPECMFGGIRGRSAEDNARRHVAQPMLLKFDIADFFPSVRPHMVYAMFVKRLGCSPDVTRFLTQITTFKGSLPQGAPASTMVANLVVEPLVLRIKGLADQHGATSGQFVDDGAISGPEHLRRLLPLVKRIVWQEGFAAQDDKTVCVGADGDQVVTGFRVNHQLDVPREKIDAVRILLKSMEADLHAGRPPSLHQLASAEGKIRDIHRTNKGASDPLRRQLNRLKACLPDAEGRRFVLKSARS